MTGNMEETKEEKTQSAERKIEQKYKESSVEPTGATKDAPIVGLASDVAWARLFDRGSVRE